jgi:predicted PurR-regulated permease PerM
MNIVKLPRIALYAFILLFLALLFIILRTMSFYLVPATFGALLAMLMLPINRYLEKLRFPRILAIITSLLIILVIIAGIITLISSQVVKFAGDLPTIQQQLTVKVTDLQEYIQNTTGISAADQMSFFDKEVNSLLASADQLATGILKATGGTLAGFGLMIIHFIFFLLYRHRIKGFLLGIISETNHEQAQHIITQVTNVTRQYLTGVVTVMAIMSVLNSTGLLILGIQNAIFFGVLAAVLNIIPYIGVWIGSGLPILLAIITKDSLLYPLGVLLTFLTTQFIDNNFLTPRITGSQVKINALATIGVILIGNMVWGIAGMILFIPLLGITKILFDNVEILKPFGYLIGDDNETGETKIARRIRKKTVKKEVAKSK